MTIRVPNQLKLLPLSCCLFLLGLLFASCSSEATNLELYESSLLKIEPLGDGVYQHTSYLKTMGWGTVSCNGMVYINEGEAIVFDTPINDSASQELLQYFEGINIKGIVVTHYHIDCLGGLAAFHAAEIPSYARFETIALADSFGHQILPQKGFDSLRTFKIGTEEIWARYYGPGHTQDNIVGFIPSYKTLFGGCLVKALKAPKGNLADADIAEWSNTVAALKADLPPIEKVIPGHGQNGDGQLLDYTIDLFRQDSPRYLFFLHNRFLETHDLNAEHPEYGRVEYEEIIAAFEKHDLKVIAEKRETNVNARQYAETVAAQIQDLLNQGIPPENITIVGTSKGGYIAQYVASLAANPKLNYVFIACYRDSDLEQLADIDFCGRILNIYESSDPFGVSARARIEQSTCSPSEFAELALYTGLKHGFLFKAMPEWIQPSIDWAKGKSLQN